MLRTNKALMLLREIVSLNPIHPAMTSQVRILRHRHDGLIGFKMLALAFVKSTIKLDFVIFQKIGETRVEWKSP